MVVVACVGRGRERERERESKYKCNLFLLVFTMGFVVVLWVGGGGARWYVWQWWRLVEE